MGTEISVEISHSLPTVLEHAPLNLAPLRVAESGMAAPAPLQAPIHSGRPPNEISRRGSEPAALGSTAAEAAPNVEADRISHSTGSSESTSVASTSSSDTIHSLQSLLPAGLSPTHSERDGAAAVDPVQAAAVDIPQGSHAPAAVEATPPAEPARPPVSLRVRLTTEHEAQLAQLQRLAAADPQTFHCVAASVARRAAVESSFLKTLADNPSSTTHNRRLMNDFHKDLAAAKTVTQHELAALKLHRCIALESVRPEQFPETAMYIKFVAMLNAAPNREALQALVANPVVSVMTQHPDDFFRHQDVAPLELQTAQNITLARSLSSAASIASNRARQQEMQATMNAFVDSHRRVTFSPESFPSPLTDVNPAELAGRYAYAGPSAAAPQQPSPFANATNLPSFTSNSRADEASGMVRTANGQLAALPVQNQSVDENPAHDRAQENRSLHVQLAEAHPPQPQTAAAHALPSPAAAQH